MMTLTLTDALPDAPFRERHTRRVDAPIDEVWPHCLDVTTRDIRTLAPLMALRSIPARLLGRASAPTGENRPLLEVFAREGFVILWRDDRPRDGRASVVFGGAGRFWSPSESQPIRFDGPSDFLDFDEPGYAKTMATLEAIDLGDGTTRIETVTVVDGTDAAARRTFAPYWALIRLPSGLIRRSWLAAVDRRATAC